MIIKLIRIMLWVIVGLSILLSCYLMFIIFVYHMELGHDLTSIAISINENPQNFQNVNFQLFPAKGFIYDLQIHHRDFGRYIWCTIGLLLLIILFQFIYIISRPKTKNVNDESKSSPI